MWKRLLQKLGLSLLAIGGFVAGIFCWALAIYPFNLPYLLHLPSETTDLIIGSVCGLLFTCIVTVSVRTKWCFENDLFFSKEDRKLRSLIKRIVTSPEFIADIVVFALWMLIIALLPGTPSGTPWYALVLGTATMMVVGTAVYAVVDCLLYVIARKKADKQLYKREAE